MSQPEVGGATTGELIRRLVLAHAKNDGAQFEVTVRELIAEERRKKHVVFARELERILASGNGLSRGTADALSLFGAAGEVPRDKDRALDLVEVIEPRRSLDDLVLAPATRAQIERILEENRRAEVLTARGLKPSRRVLFCGPPGCGKTVTAEAIASILYLPLVLVRFDAAISSYLGETAANLRRVFEYARGRPMVLLFDEFDAIGKRRDDAEEHGELKRVVNSFLQMLDRYRGDTLTIAATNHEQLLDPAIWRRFDDVVVFPRPTKGNIEQVFSRLWRQTRLNPDVRIPDLARKLEGVSHSDVERVAMDALKEMVLRDRSSLDSETVKSSLERENARLELLGLRAGNKARNGKAPAITSPVRKPPRRRA